jgi:hypothetical protein
MGFFLTASSLSDEASPAVTSVPDLSDKNLHYFSKIFLHLWKFAVISQLRTNFAENARESLPNLGAAQRTSRETRW